MKATQVRPEPAKQPVETKPCLSCGKSIAHPYGTFKEGWVCSRKCNEDYVAIRYARSTP